MTFTPEQLRVLHESDRCEDQKSARSIGRPRIKPRPGRTCKPRHLDPKRQARRVYQREWARRKAKGLNHA